MYVEGIGKGLAEQAFWQDKRTVILGMPELEAERTLVYRFVSRMAFAEHEDAEVVELVCQQRGGKFAPPTESFADTRKTYATREVYDTLE